MRTLVVTILFALASGAHGAAADVQSLMAEGKLPQALARVEEDLARDKSDVTLQFLKGLVLTRLNRLDQAARVFERITEEHPELPEPYNNLAVVHAARGDFDAAQQALQKAINTHPSYATAHENLGDIYARMASEAYNHALQLDQGNSSAKTKLALINDLFPAPAGEAAPAAKPAVAEAPAQPAPRVEMPGQQAPAAAATTPVPGPAPAPTPEPTPTPVVADTATTAPAPAPVPEPKVDEGEAVRRVVDEWAAAWSAQDVDAYLSAYGAEFAPPDGMSRGNWEDVRRTRVRAPRFIKVTLSGMRVTPHGPEHAQASFNQRYESDAFTDTVRKTLILKKSGGDWKIVEETLR